MNELRCVCATCSCTLVTLKSGNDSTVTWACSFCGRPMMGLSVPIQPKAFQKPSRLYTCLEVCDLTEVAS